MHVTKTLTILDRSFGLSRLDDREFTSTKVSKDIQHHTRRESQNHRDTPRVGR
jgi:hypothetical protein